MGKRASSGCRLDEFGREERTLGTRGCEIAVLSRAVPGGDVEAALRSNVHRADEGRRVDVVTRHCTTMLPASKIHEK
jgi:hypothetical protein